MRAIVLLRRPCDVALVRAGVSLGQCTAICAAPEAEARPLLVAARAAGATRAIQLWDAALEGHDFLAVATSLAAAIRTAAGELGATAILAGDRGRGAVGPALAERMQLPLLGQVLGIEMHEKRLTARRRFRAVVKLYAAELPAVVCLIVDENAAVEAPKSHGKHDKHGKHERHDKHGHDKHGHDKHDEIESWDLARVGLSPAELSYRKRFLPHPSPGPERVPRRLPDGRALAERLRADGLIAPPEKR